MTVTIQGILLVNHQSVHAPGGMVRLWMHEMSRVFGDRLAESNHRVVFEHMLIEAVGRSVSYSAICFWWLPLYPPFVCEAHIALDVWLAVDRRFDLYVDVLIVASRSAVDVCGTAQGARLH